MKVIENVVALDSTKGSYVYLITGEENILIDTGRPDQRKRILKDLKAMNIKIEDIQHILLTHHDIDHIGNAAYLQKEANSKVWASKEDIQFISGEKNRPGIKRIIQSVIRVGKPENLNAYDETGKVGEVKVIPTPGHTPGHVCLLYKDALFVGDLIHLHKGQLEPYPSFWNWNTDLLLSSIKKIADIPFEWICPSHGTPIKRGAFDELVSNLNI